MSTDTAAGNADPAVRPFHVDVVDEAVADLRRRVAAWRPPEREPVSDQSQGVQLGTVQDLADYWAAEYDWRRCEAMLNTLPQFITTIDGLDIHFIHVRSPEPDALPLIVTHGWPGSVIEQLKIIEPLTNPAEHGGNASDAFDVVIPSLPGYGFSGKPAVTGWGPERIARAWAVLMERLGYTRYAAQGGDWGTAVSAAMARQAPDGLLGIHVNFAQNVPPDVLGHIRNGDPAPADLSDAGKARV
jgi:Epoxide hydrolase N terminus